MAEPLKLLAILAHPDDESLGVGSTLAKYAAEGVETYLICATNGQRGWMGSEQDDPGPDALGKIRKQELTEAARELQLSKVFFLDYLDGDLDKADGREVQVRIAAIIRELQPQVVLSFAPDGAYGHPDHIAISQFSAGAIVLAADINFSGGSGNSPHQVSKFYYFVNSVELVQSYSAVFGNIEMEIDDVKRGLVAWDDWAVTTTVDAPDNWRAALRAVNCHKSQVAIYGDLNSLPEAQSLKLWARRNYYRVFSLVNSGRRVETDLFAGIR